MLLLLQRKTYIHKTTTCIFVALWFEKSLVSVFTQAQKCEVITSHPFSVLYCDKYTSSYTTIKMEVQRKMVTILIFCRDLSYFSEHWYPIFSRLSSLGQMDLAAPSAPLLQNRGHDPHHTLCHRDGKSSQQRPSTSTNPWGRESLGWYSRGYGPQSEGKRYFKSIEFWRIYVPR